MINADVFEEAFNLLCFDQIGAGMSRQVFSSKLLPDCVIKVEQDPGRFQNIIEWEAWQRVSFTPFSRWFAECKWISPDGKILIMERTRPPAASEFPDKVPVFLSDLKRTNFGMSTSAHRSGDPGKDWFVCHDYGTNLLFEHGMSKRMRKAEWLE